MFQKFFITAILNLAICFPATAQGHSNPAYDVDAKIDFRPKKVLRPSIKGKLKTSGYCCLVLDITETGVPQNVEVSYCTYDFLEATAVDRLSRFRYKPATKDSVAVRREYKEVKLGFMKFNSQYGPAVPSPNGYLTPNRSVKTIPPRPKKAKARQKWLRKYFDNTKVCPSAMS